MPVLCIHRLGIFMGHQLCMETMGIMAYLGMVTMVAIIGLGMGTMALIIDLGISIMAATIDMGMDTVAVTIGGIMVEAMAVDIMVGEPMVADIGDS